MSTRLQQTLNDLNVLGYEFSSLKRLRGGINSSVFQAKSSNGVNFIIKLYCLPTQHDKRNRCLAEKHFLEYVQSCQSYKTPVLHESSISAGWALLSWLDGCKPNALEISDLTEITNFISEINNPSAEQARVQLQPASEACESLSGLITSIAERLKQLKSTNPTEKTSQEAIHWIGNTLEPHFCSISKRLLDTRTNCSHWQDLQVCKIASPSDVGIHNTMRSKKGLLFLDFEYAGLDDLSKLAADWILQPEYLFNREKEESFCNQLMLKMESAVGFSWRTRLDDIKPLIHIKWCLIMLKRLQTNNLSKQQLQKALAYFEKQR